MKIDVFTDDGIRFLNQEPYKENPVDLLRCSSDAVLILRHGLSKSTAILCMEELRRYVEKDLS